MKSLALIVLTGCAVLAGCASNGGTPPTRTERCKVTTEQEIASLFDRWNQSLQTGDPHKVVANYAERSILLPTVSNKPRLTQRRSIFPEQAITEAHHGPRRRIMGFAALYPSYDYELRALPCP